MTLRRAGMTCALGAAVVLAGAAPAGADWESSQGGQWYYTVTGVQEAHETTTGEGVTIALVDSPLNTGLPTLADADIRAVDSWTCEATGEQVPATGSGQVTEHASGMAEVLVGNGATVGADQGPRGVAPGARVLHYATVYEDSTLGDCVTRPVEIVQAAVADGADIVNMSFSGWSSSPELVDAVAAAQRAGVIFVIAMPNTPPSGGFDLGWPETMNGAVTVEAVGVDSMLDENPVSSPFLTVLAPGVEIARTSWADGAWDLVQLGSGTSPATAWTSGVLALAMSAHPDATPNQILQALIRNTGGSTHAPERTDDFGYGIISVASLLADDPTQYEDVNPLLRDDSEALPTIAQIEGATAAPTQPAGPTAEQDPAAEEPTGAGVPLGVVVGAGAALLVLIIVALAVLRRRRAGVTSTQPPTTHGGF